MNYLWAILVLLILSCGKSEEATQLQKSSAPVLELHAYLKPLSDAEPHLEGWSRMSLKNRQMWLRVALRNLTSVKELRWVLMRKRRCLEGTTMSLPDLDKKPGRVNRRGRHFLSRAIDQRFLSFDMLTHLTRSDLQVLVYGRHENQGDFFPIACGIYSTGPGLVAPVLPEVEVL